MSTRPGMIDVHAHLLAPRYREALKASGLLMIGGILIPPWTPELPTPLITAFRKR